MSAPTEIDQLRARLGEQQGVSRLSYQCRYEFAAHTLAAQTGRVHRVGRSITGHDDALTRAATFGQVVQSAWTASGASRAGSVVLLVGSELVYVRGQVSGAVEVCAFATTEQRAVDACDRVARALARDETIALDRVRVRMWHAGVRAMCSTMRVLAAPTLNETLQVLSSNASTSLNEVITRGPAAGGVHVWHGPPGCGKTSAIRTLAGAWRDAAQIELVLDPEELLASTAYLNNLLDGIEQPLTGDGSDAPEHRVIVLEDAGELVGADARQRTGHGLSRLLNLTDGMFGDHRSPTVIITTNEPIGRLHPALTRAGRCRSVVEFRPMDQQQARSWLTAHGHGEMHVAGAITIAELAALAHDTKTVRDSTPAKFGF